MYCPYRAYTMHSCVACALTMPFFRAAHYGPRFFRMVQKHQNLQNMIIFVAGRHILFFIIIETLFLSISEKNVIDMKQDWYETVCRSYIFPFFLFFSNTSEFCTSNFRSGTWIEYCLSKVRVYTLHVDFYMIHNNFYPTWTYK